MISFIVPVRYTNTKSYIYQRSTSLIKLFESSYPNIEFIISDSSRSKKLVSNSQNIKILNFPYDENLYSPAKARNDAIKYVTMDYVFFFDVDLLFSDNFINLLLREVMQEMNINKKKFLMFPCLYLSEKGSDFFENNKLKQEGIDFLKEDYLLGNCDLVLRLAVNTSAIVITKEYFIELSMFSEDFSGHGGEDFELLHRLASYSAYSQKPEEYYDDIVQQHPAYYQGFRKYLAYYSLPYFFSNLILVHMWHKRKLFNPFYLKRTSNESLLVEKMKNHDMNNLTTTWLSKKTFINYDDFLKSLLVKFGYKDKKYCGFYKFNQSCKMKRPISAKIRKLFTRPQAFFDDMKIVQYLRKFVSNS